MCAWPVVILIPRRRILTPPPPLCFQGQSGEPGLKGQVSSSPPSLPNGCFPLSGSALSPPPFPPSPSFRSLLSPHRPLAARSPWRDRLPRPQRRCWCPRSAGLPRPSRAPRTGGRSRRARTTRKTGCGGEWTPGIGDSIERESFWGAAYYLKLGVPRGVLASRKIDLRSRMGVTHVQKC